MTAGAVLGTPATQLTGSNGVATFTSVAIGLYLVEEVGAPAGVVGSSPFLVTMPMTNPAGDGWMWEVHVYPKNDVVELEKDADASGAYTLGDTVGYTLTADLPMSPVWPPERFVIRDVSGFEATATTTADDVAGLLHVDPADVSVSVTVDGTVLPLVEGTHYVLSDTNVLVHREFDAQLSAECAAAPDDFYQWSYFTLTLTDQGFNAITALTTVGTEEAFPGGTLSVKYDATLMDADVPEGVDLGEFANLAGLYTEPEHDACYEPALTDPVTVVTSIVRFAKEDDGGAARAGAGFSVWPALTDAQGAPTCQGPVTSTPPIRMMVSGEEATTDGTPVGLNSGSTTPDASDDLLFDDGQGGYRTGELVYGFYCLVEVSAPPGFELLPTAVLFEVSATTSWGLTEALAHTPIVNYPDNAGFDLPFTGDVAGLSWWTWAGIALLLAGVIFLVVQRRRHHTEVPRPTM